MSGKEATVYAVRCGNEIFCAKACKLAEQRNLGQSTAYQAGRKEKNSRKARGKGTRSGRNMRVDAWQKAAIVRWRTDNSSEDNDYSVRGWRLEWRDP